MARPSILIVGGGSAGWLAAAYLSRTLNRRTDAPVITVVEAPEVGAIGVGEGSFPTLRGTLASLGVGEAEFMRSCSATFKQGVFFQDWARPGHAYFHPFNLPYEEAGDLSSAWLTRRRSQDAPSYAEAVTAQAQVVAAGCGPKRIGDPDFSGPMNYAYHFDANQFAAFLRHTATDAGVRHVQGLVTAVQRADDGNITSVEVQGLGALAADLFIDCSGFSARLFKDLPSTWRSCADVLPNDRAVAMAVPYDRPDAPIAPFTRATAQPGGWIWDIGLTQRRGLGYVYSTRYTDDDEAEHTLRTYVGPRADALSTRLLRFEGGYRTTQWAGNCVAVGLSAGFFEPLESTGLMLIEAAVRLIAETPNWTDRETLAASERRFNAQMSGRFERVVDFLKLHYCLSQRCDSAYWRDNCDPASWPESLADRLALWRYRPVSRLDFVVDLETFLPASWRYVLYGMDFRPDACAAADAVSAKAAAAFARVAQARTEAVRHLPDHRTLLAHYHAGRAPPPAVKPPSAPARVLSAQS